MLEASRVASACDGLTSKQISVHRVCSYEGRSSSVVFFVLGVQGDEIYIEVVMENRATSKSLSNHQRARRIQSNQTRAVATTVSRWRLATTLTPW